jgi:acetyl esterase/lipase
MLSASAAAAATERPVIPLYAEGALPTSTTPEGVVEVEGERWVHNVSDPTLTVYLPPRGNRTGAAVIVAPGGAFQMLSWDNEGVRVAQRLAKSGVAAFVLKYRLAPSPADASGFKSFLEQLLARLEATSPTPEVVTGPFPTEALASEDAAAAVALVRHRAGEWGIEPNRIGFVGFSAGAITAANVAIGPRSGRPDFVGIIYGRLRGKVPADAPPAFIATATDDPLVPATLAIATYSAWRAAGRPAELHLYEAGSHGFGMKLKGTTSDHWAEEFLWWMRARGALGPTGR